MQNECQPHPDSCCRLDHGLPRPGQVPYVELPHRLVAQALDEDVLEERRRREERHDGIDGCAVPAVSKTVNPVGLGAEGVHASLVGVPVGGVVVDNEVEAHALDVDGDAPHRIGEALRATGAEDPRVVRLVADAVPVVPHLRAPLREVVEHEPVLAIEAQRAVLRRDAGELGQHDVAAMRVGAEDEAAGPLGRLIEGELDGLLRAAGLEIRQVGRQEVR